MRSELVLASRVLVRRPILSLAISLTIGLAIAATTVAYAVVDGILLEPLPYAEPDRLVTIWERTLNRDQPRNTVSPANVIAWREQLRSVERVASLVELTATLAGDGEPEQIGLLQASADYFPVLGAEPLLGRLYGAADDVFGGPRVAVLSEGFWRRRYGADPGVVGRPVELNGTSYEVIGVLPARFDLAPRYAWGLGHRDVLVPPQYPPDARQFGGRFLQVIAKLAPGATVAGLQQEASALAARLREEFPERMQGWDVNVVPLHRELVGDVRTPLLVIFGAVVFVLGIACANVANLLLARGGERQQEMAVRAALGAGRGRLLRQLLLESALLAAAGGALGLGLAGLGIRALVAAAPDLPRLGSVGLDASVIGFALLAVAITALAFGLAPALQLSRRQLSGWLTQRLGSASRAALRLRGVLVGAQVALSFVLLVGAGLLVRSLVNRLGTGIGLDLDNVLTAAVNLPGNRYAAPEARAAFFEEAVDRIARLPGVVAASAGSIVPMNGDAQGTRFIALDRPVPAPGEQPVADVRWVHRDYHRAFRIPLVAGRFFDDRDRPGAPTAVLINQAGARQLWPNESAVGKRIAMEWGDTLNAEIVGVVGDVRLNGPDDPASRATLYWEHRQAPMTNRMVLVARTDGAPEAMAGALRAAVREIDPNLPLYHVRTMRDLFAGAVARARFTTAALASFAALALLLAGLGLYGVMAYVTQQREREIGIRMALGADQPTVVRLILGQGLRVVGPALLAGGAMALGLSRLLGSLVFGVGLADPVTFGGVALVLGLTALAACWLPARRASGIDPLAAIRSE